MTPTTASTAESPFKVVFACEGYPALWITNLLASIVNGSSRFVFVWLITELTDWEAAVALLGVAMGIPALVLSVPAGRLADSKPTELIGVRSMAAAATVLLVFGLLAAMTDLPVAGAIGLAFLAGVPVAVVTPALQAAVPGVVPHNLILPAVTLQNMGMMVGTIGGAFIGGAAIRFITSAGALLVLAGASAAAAMVISGSDIPAPARHGDSAERPSMRPVLKMVLTTEPLRGLMFLTMVTGFVMTAVMLLLPVVAKEVLLVGSLEASLLNVAMGVGMLAMSAVLTSQSARIRLPGRLCLIALSLGLGTGLFLLGWSQNYLLSLAFAAGWGSMGGIAMNLLRSLTQQAASVEQMGRVMGVAVLAQFGAFPIAAGILYVVVAATDARTAMMLFGAATAVLVWTQWLNPSLRRR